MVADPSSLVIALAVALAATFFCFRWIFRNSGKIGMEGFGAIFLILGVISGFATVGILVLLLTELSPTP